MIANTLQQKIGEAMKARDVVRLSTLRMLSSAFNYEKIEKQHELNDEEELAVIRKEAKRRKEAIEGYEKSPNKEIVKERLNQEKEELAILQEYLPPEITREEIEKLVDSAILELGVTQISDMGKVIGLVKSKASGVDGSTLAGIVREKLSS